MRTQQLGTGGSRGRSAAGPRLYLNWSDPVTMSWGPQGEGEHKHPGRSERRGDGVARSQTSEGAFNKVPDGADQCDHAQSFTLMAMSQACHRTAGSHKRWQEQAAFCWY